MDSPSRLGWERCCVSGAAGPSYSVYTIVLNWNGWKDTVECLESLFRLDYSNNHIVVVDNGSSDGSVQHICAWAAGSEVPVLDTPSTLRSLSDPPVTKPIPVTMVVCDTKGEPPGPPGSDCALTIIETGANLGYAGGNNVGIRYALAHHADYVWILNNDTAVDSRALSAVMNRATQDARIGLCGSTLLEYREPHVIQVSGGAHYNYRTSRHTIAGRGLTLERQPSSCEVETSLSYVSGASVLVRAQYLRAVGLMDERYFLYFEELDWASRGRSLGYVLGYASDSFVYHKEGSSTGFRGRDLDPNPVAQYYSSRSLLLVTGRFHRAWLPVLRAKVLGTSLQRLLTGHPDLARAIVLAVFEPGLAAFPDNLRQRFSEDS